MYVVFTEEDETYQKNEVFAALLEFQVEDRAQLTVKELLGEYGVSGGSPPIVTRIQELDSSETVFRHDKQLLYDSKTIWKIGKDELLATNNGGKTWVRYVMPILDERCIIPPNETPMPVIGDNGSINIPKEDLDKAFVEMGLLLYRIFESKED